MPKELTLELVQSQMRPNQQLTISEDTVAEIQKLAEDPDYGQEFLDCYLDHLNVYKDNPGRSHTQYLNAVKFFSLVEADNNLTDAYIKTFPERFKERTKPSKFGDPPKGKEVMRGEASRYNSSKLVNEIRRIATIPVQLIHRHILHEAILEQAELMRNAKSEMVRQKAGATLIAELKPAEDQVLKVEVEDNTTSVIEDLHNAVTKLAAAQHEKVVSGTPIKEISAAKLIGSDEVEPVDE